MCIRDRIYNVEITFFESLEESGLLQTLIEDEKKYLLYEQLTAFERYANLHYDLEVNLPGIEIISHLLKKMEILENENRKLAVLSRSFQKDF